MALDVRTGPITQVAPGVGEVQHFMPPPRTGRAAHRHRFIRRVVAVRGQMRFIVDVARFDYARARHEVALTAHSALFRARESRDAARNVAASPDGLAGEEATFSLCSFWRVEALARAGRRVEALGNSPQAFTHVALISAAHNLDRRLG